MGIKVKRVEIEIIAGTHLGLAANLAIGHAKEYGCDVLFSFNQVEFCLNADSEVGYVEEQYQDRLVVLKKPVKGLRGDK